MHLVSGANFGHSECADRDRENMERQLRAELTAEFEAKWQHKEDEIRTKLMEDMRGECQREERSLRSQVADLEAELKANGEHLRRVTSEAEKSLQVKGVELKNAQSSIQEHSRAREIQKGEVGRLISIIETEKKTIDTLHIKLTTSQRHLQACKDDLYLLQPTGQVPDTFFIHEFHSLCQNVASWIDDEIAIYEISRTDVGPADLFSDGGDPSLNLDMKAFPYYGEYWIRYWINRYLHAFVFNSESYLPGLALRVTDFLLTAENAMTILNPPRDQIKRINWRSETLTAIAATEGYAEAKARKKFQSTDELFKGLIKYFPPIKGRVESVNKLRENVVAPAIELAIRLNISTTKYSIQMPDIHQVHPLTMELLPSASWIDVATRKPIKPTSAVVTGKQGVIGSILMPIEPSMIRIDSEELKTELRVPTLLAKLKST